MKKEIKKAKCYNCKYATEGFKVVGKTMHHCQSPTYEKMANDGNPPSPWETVRYWYQTCNEHDIK